ncbi:metallophosphoesterase family protein [Planomicrobium sp. CPCC 101079]|uniref:metallophosphoesterase family protein n=1 Tax=Planomicrobium sp. CPCC 101079 TaxID=2599618 RepID=UPI0011B70FBE|nr:metallophosphoesterase family protein [Planomicrobium sp. CPCC 101079]TWT09347.1 serine/threonine protein phosphatase [Planomicrobium sp. CPCC 101079]
MDHFVIGDIHGCFYTFKKLVEEHWDREKEMLVQVGDLVDRGKHVPQTVQFARQLASDFPERAYFIKGNHEAMLLEHFANPPSYNWLRQGGQETLDQYAAAERNLANDIKWLESLPLFYDHDKLFVSHAGIAQNTHDPFDEDNPYGILWNRSKLKNLSKLQIVGHTPIKEPKFDPDSHAYYIDTGAAYAGSLTGIKIDQAGEPLELFQVKTDSRDL